MLQAATKAAAYNRLLSLNPTLAEQTTGPRGGHRDGIVDAIPIAMWGKHELRNSYWPSRSGVGCFPASDLPKSSKGAKALKEAQEAVANADALSD